MNAKTSRYVKNLLDRFKWGEFEYRRDKDT